MSARQLLTPSNPPAASPRSCTFRLQPPPHRYREKRRGRILSKEDVLSAPSQQPSQSDEGQSLLSAMIDASSTGEGPWTPLLTGEHLARLSRVEDVAEDDADDDDDASTVRGDDLDTYERPKRLLQGDPRLVYSDTREHGSLLTSPVKGMVRNSTFFSELRGEESVMLMEEKTYSSEDSPPLTSTTSSFSSVARSVLSGTLRHRGSLQSVKSPTKGREGLSSPITLTNEVGHTVVNLLPMSPITPRRSATLHTPRVAQFEESKVNTHLILPIRKHDSEPLSATLRRIGAARDSMSVDEEMESMDNIESHLLKQDWEARMAERLLNHKKAAELIEANQHALRQSDGIFSVKSEGLGRQDVVDEGSMSWLAHDPCHHPSSNKRHPANKHIQSTIRGGQQASTVRSTLGRLSMMLTGYLYGNHHCKRQDFDNDSVAMATFSCAEPVRPDSTAPMVKGDGWGGLRPRSSWFPDLRLGPLVSPTKSFTPTHLRPFRLQTTTRSNDEDAWEDEEEVTLTTEQLKSLVEHGEDDEEEEAPIKKLRVKFPSILPQPSRDRRCSSNSTNDGDSDDGIVIKYTKKSAEGGPATRRGIFQPLSFLVSNGGLFLALVLVICMAAILAAIATSVIAHSKNATVSDYHQAYFAGNQSYQSPSNP